VIQAPPCDGQKCSDLLGHPDGLVLELFQNLADAPAALQDSSRCLGEKVSSSSNWE
jgi:hypothetical protein